MKLHRTAATAAIVAVVAVVAVAAFILSVCLFAEPASGQIVISANEGKIDLTSGGPKPVPNPAPDSLTILDFATFPPTTFTIPNLPNTVIGPPSNVAITPDGALALVANSAALDPADPAKTVPLREIHLVDLKSNPPRVTGRVSAGLQPSGMSITPDGRLALVANRAAGSVTVLRLDGARTSAIAEVQVAAAASSLSDIAIAPDGRTALASLQKAGALAELTIRDEQVEPTGRLFSVYGSPYRVVISPDGRFALTSGAGLGNGVDADAVSVVDLRANPPRTVQHLTTGVVPESVEISPDGDLLAVVTMEGSNLAPDNPNRSRAGGLYLYRRSGERFELSQTVETGRIPEGVAFTKDGRHLVVQCHPDQELRIYSVRGGRVRDTGERVRVPGMPSAIRASR